MDDIVIEVYGAEWCGPCKAIHADLNALKAKGWHINEIDVDKQRGLAATNNVGAIPTFIIKKDGVVVDRFSGAKPGRVLEQHFTNAAG